MILLSLIFSTPSFNFRLRYCQQLILITLLALLLSHSKMVLRRGAFTYRNYWRAHYVRINEELSRIDWNKNAGPDPDHIPASFISNCSSNLIEPLLSLFNSSLQSVVFPEKWKPCYIRPTHKSGCTNNIENYRPITTTCAMVKLLD